MTTQPARPLSKSQYTRGMQCEKSLWLYRHRKDLKDPIDPFLESIFRSGTAFGQLAMERFPGGVLIKADHLHPEEALEETKAAIAAGATVLYEAAFLYEGVLVRTDVIIKQPGGWDLYEVKSSTKVEAVYLLDVAIQRYVMNGAGFPDRISHVVHANPGYVRYGKLDLGKLFAVVDVTKESAEAMVYVPANLKRLKAQADAPEAPAVGIGEHCSKPYDCDFRGNCWAHIPEYSVFNLAYAKMDKKLELFNRGVQFIHQINPTMEKLTDKRSVRQVEISRLAAPRIEKETIGTFLNSLVYPIAHLDFETDNPAVPPYDGLRPYQQMPFQASVRVQHSPGGKPTEATFLGDGLSDPRSELVAFLCAEVPNRGSVLAYYKSFEGGRLTELATAALYPAPQSNQLVNIAQRLVDLADPFSKGWYAHASFKGRWSIKAVLPVLIPDMTYENLVIKDGTAAMAAYAELRDPKTPPARREELATALKVYCGQDTMAMVRILDHLYAIVAGKVTA